MPKMKPGTWQAVNNHLPKDEHSQGAFLWGKWSWDLEKKAFALEAFSPEPFLHRSRGQTQNPFLTIPIHFHTQRAKRHRRIITDPTPVAWGSGSLPGASATPRLLPAASTLVLCPAALQRAHIAGIVPPASFCLWLAGGERGGEEGHGVAHSGRPGPHCWLGNLGNII